MKLRYSSTRLFSIALFLFSGILFFAGITEKSVVFSAQLDPLNLSPDLPDVPFKYTVDEFPEHLAIQGWGEMDTTQLHFLDDDKATLGRVLFYDEVISANQNMSCATCHSQAKSFADEAAFSMGVNTETTRNSMHLNDLGWSSNEGHFWDLRESDMQEMISLPLKDENEIGAVNFTDLEERMIDAGYYEDLFDKAFGDEMISEERISEAITQFISSMVTFDSKLDQFEKGEASFTDEEIAGRVLFQNNCEFCHTGGAVFATSSTNTEDLINAIPFLFTNGLPPGDDLGVGNWLPEFEHLFKAPTLRNIEQTAAYMHDGRFEDLDAVITHYSDEAVDDGWGFVPPGGFGFNANQKENLKAFLLTMTDESFLVDERWSDPFDSESSTEEPLALEGITLGPNPATDYTVVRLDNPNQRMVEVYLYDLAGKLIRKQSTHTNSVLIDVTALSSGNYIVKIKAAQDELAKKLIVL